MKINLENYSREKLILNLRNSVGKKFEVEDDGKEVSFVVNEDGKGKIYLNIFYDGKPFSYSFIDDFLIDLRKKEVILGKEYIKKLLEALEKSLECVQFKKIKQQYPELFSFKIVGRNIEWLLKAIKIIGIEQDLRYFGKQKKSGEPYEGRYIFINLLKKRFLPNKNGRTMTLGQIYKSCNVGIGKNQLKNYLWKK